MKFLLISLLALAAAQAQEPSRANLYSVQKEEAIGVQYAEQFERASPPVNNPDARRYLQQVGARLAMQLPNAPFSFVFTLMADTDLTGKTGEPLAIPGGYIYVPMSLFLKARDESEFAGMLAHAMAHVAERHGTRQATKATVDQLAVIPLAAQASIPVTFIQFSKAYEQQADSDAVKMASGAGYDPEGLLRYLARETNASGTRLDALRAAIGTPAPSSNDEFLRLQNQLRNTN